MENRHWQRHYDYDVPLSIRYPAIPAQHFLFVTASGFADKTALDFYGTPTSYWQLRQQVLRLANALGALGVGKGDRVGLHLPTCPQYVIGYHACLCLGAIVVNLNPMYTAEELERLIRDTGISVLITFDMVLPSVRPLAGKVDLAQVIVTRITDFINGFAVSTPADLDLEKGWRHFSQLLDSGTRTSVPKVAIAPNDPALIQFTGGTTGVPKGAVLTHANLVAATIQVSFWGRATTGAIPVERRSVLSVLPYFHVYGAIVAMSWAVFNGATQILVPRFEIDEFIGILQNHPDITFFPTVPTLINALLNHPKARDLELEKRLGLLNSGAAPMPVEMIDQINAMGIAFNEGWGMSETTSLGIANPVLGLKKAGSIGVPWPDTDVRLVNVEDGRTPVGKGEAGEIVIKSPLVMQGYWNHPEETAGQLQDGWLHTGDVAVADEDGYVFIVDRKKDMIIAGGYNIYPREIDEVLYRHPKIKDACTIGVPDPYRGETVKAFVVVRDGEQLTEDEVLAFCKDKLAPYKRPKQVAFRADLPKSAVGKILRKVLRAEQAAGKQ